MQWFLFLLSRISGRKGASMNIRKVEKDLIELLSESKLQVSIHSYAKPLSDGMYEGLQLLNEDKVELLDAPLNLDEFFSQYENESYSNQLKLLMDRIQGNSNPKQESSELNVVESKRQQKMKEIQQKLEEGVENIYSSGKYAEYLSTMSKFHHYSINNCILIASQKPDASLVAGYEKWKKEFHRHVNRGEKGIMIFAPHTGKAKYTVENIDESGNTEEKEVEKEYTYFRRIFVYDVSQTSGEPVPSLVTELQGQVDSFEKYKNALESVSPVPVFYQDIQGQAHGYYHPGEKKIVIQNDMSELQTIKTMIHEIAHATLDHGSEEDVWDKNTKEVQAESVAYWVTQMLGLDTSDYSFGYIAGWSKDKTFPELKENLSIIKLCADEISQKLETAFKMISKVPKQTKELDEQHILQEGISVLDYEYENGRYCAVYSFEDQGRMKAAVYVDEHGAYFDISPDSKYQYRITGTEKVMLDNFRQRTEYIQSQKEVKEKNAVEATLTM